MKFVKNRSEFINSSVNEKFDMSGDGSGPMGNDINWGDSLVGRLFNSAGRKAKIGIDSKRAETLANRIKSEFDDLLFDSISRNSDSSVTSSIEITKISYLLGSLKDSVFEGKKVKFLITETKYIIDYVEKFNVSDSSGKIDQNSKDELLKQLNDFLEFLKGFELNEGQTGLSSEVTGLEEGEDPSKTEFEAEESKSSTGLKYKDMISLLKSLKLIVDNKDNVKTFAQGEQEKTEKAKDINYVLNNIISSLNDGRTDDTKFRNDLISRSDIANWPILKISGNKIIYRMNKKLVELTSDGQLMVDIPKYDSTNKRYTGESKPRLIDFNKENIKRISNYISNQLTEIKNTINSDVSLKLNKNEVEWFNKNLKGKWLVMKSSKGNAYKTQIGECNEDGRVNFLTPPVKSQAAANVNTILSKGKLYKDKKEANAEYDKLYKEGNPVLNKKGSISSIDKKSTGSDVKKQTPVKEKEVEEVKESYSIFEKTVLGGVDKTDKEGRPKDQNPNEDITTQSLNRIKKMISSMIDNGVDSKFLDNVIKVSKEKDENSKLKNTKIIKLFLKDIKQSYLKLGDLGKLFKESLEDITNASKRQTMSDKIARFAKFSLQLENENLYGTLGELGDPIEDFNKLFNRLLKTEFQEAKSESNLFKYEKFMLIKESTEVKNKTSIEIKEYFVKNMDYDRWIIRKTDVDSIIKNVDEASKKTVKFGSDNIIEIAKLFNKAYKIYTTPTIPSGRSNGKVSNKTFREYTYLGSGSPGTPTQPGYGPWRNNKIFDRFESIIQDIMKEDEYRPLFSAESILVMGDGTEKKGGGKLLLRFINDLLDGDSLYKEGAQKKFVEKYFNLEITSDKLGNTSKSSSKDEPSTADIADDVKIKEDLFFKSVSSIEGEERALYAFATKESNKFTYLYIVSSDDKKVQFKYSMSMNQFKKYYNDFNIKKGDIFNIEDSVSDVLFSSVNPDKFPIKVGDEIKLKYVSLKDYRKNKTSINVKEGDLGTPRGEMYVLSDKDGNTHKLSNKSSDYKKGNDTKEYTTLTQKIKQG